MQIIIYATVLAIAVLVLLLIGHVLVNKWRNPWWIIALAFGLILVTVGTSYFVQAVHVRKAVVAWR